MMASGAPENLSLPAGGPDGGPMPKPPPLDPPPGGPQPPGRPSCLGGPSENPGGPPEGSISLAAPCASHSTLCSWAMSDRVASFSSGGGASIDRHLHKPCRSSPHHRSELVLGAARALSRAAAVWNILHWSSSQEGTPHLQTTKGALRSPDEIFIHAPFAAGQVRASFCNVLLAILAS